MAALCDLALVFGLTLGGACQPPAPAAEPLPGDDAAAWSFKVPEPRPEPPKPAPAFPPVVIRQEVIREVHVPAPTPPPAPPPAPAPPPKVVVAAPNAPDPLELAARAAYQARSAGLPAWPGVTVPAGLATTGSAAALNAPAPPLDLAAVTGGNREAQYREASITSSLPVDNNRVVTTDRYIAALVETGINTQLDGGSGGPVVLQVTRDVFGYHGRNILIPKGSRLVCGFQPLDKVGSSRAPLRCGRMLLGGHRAEIFGMKANGADMQGALGVAGDVDNRFWERYGTAFVLAGISTAVRAATTSTTTSEGLASRSNALDTGGEELSQRLGEITASALEQTINLTPILRVHQGTRVQIRPDTDWYIAPLDSRQE